MNITPQRHDQNGDWKEGETKQTATVLIANRFPYDLKANSIRGRLFHSRRFIIGRSQRVAHSAVENILQLHAFPGGSVTISEDAMKMNLLFRTDIDEIDTSATSRNLLEGGLGIIIRPWEETILDTARQYYNL
jgi:hypothetical protein